MVEPPDQVLHDVDGGVVAFLDEQHADLKSSTRADLERLAEIKADPALKTIPVVVLTSSRAEQDVLRGYELQANCYITKPVDLEQFITVIQSIENFWLTLVTLPQST